MCVFEDNASDSWGGFFSSRAIFDEYLYYGLDEEKWSDAHEEGRARYKLLSKDERQDNRRHRMGLTLMGCHVDTAKTRVDLAILAKSKLFLGHHSTMHFMDTLWIRFSPLKASPDHLPSGRTLIRGRPCDKLVEQRPVF